MKTAARPYADYRRKRCDNCGAGLFTDRTVCYFDAHNGMRRHRGLSEIPEYGPEGQCGGNLVEADDDRCSKAALGHGPGHQSTTECDVRGEHDLHHCTYGSFRQEAWWREDGLTCSGFFDEPPEER